VWSFRFWKRLREVRNWGHPCSTGTRSDLKNGLGCNILISHEKIFDNQARSHGFTKSTCRRKNILIVLFWKYLFLLKKIVYLSCCSVNFDYSC
jgi:hypothetical protein